MAVTDTARRSEEARVSREGTASPVYFLLHMPRTGGNTIAAHLKAHLGNRVCTALRPAPLEVLGGRRYRLDENPDFRQVRAVTGHYLGRSLERRFPGREIRRTLLLRDPVGFHVSYYNHRMMFSLSRGGPTCDFERHLRAQPRDLVPLLLLWYWLEMPLRTFLATGDARKYELLSESLAGFWFVGNYQEGDRLLEAVAADFGLPTTAQRRNTTSAWRKRVSWRPLRVEDLSDATRRAILAKNPIHDALWRDWREAGFNTADTAPPPWRAGGAGGLGLRDLVRAVMADQFIPPIWRRIGRASSARDWPRAARLYRKALRQAPDAPAVWVQYGHALKETGDVAGAEIAYRRAVALAPDVAEWHLFLGEALLRQGRTEEARAALLRCEQLDPVALQQKQLELAARGNPAETVAAYWRALTGARTNMRHGGPPRRGGGLILAAPASGSGKTLLTLGLLRLLRDRGLRVAAAKAGPDYIDPTFHAAASGGVCLNLDAWAMREATLRALVDTLESEADIVLCEGVMGLFDGTGPDGEAGSTAALARLTGWPVVLVVDARRQGASAAALVAGFARHDPAVPLAGVVFNRVAGERHRALLETALTRHLPGLPCLGAVLQDPALTLPERHLGLVPAGEQHCETAIARAAEAAAAGLDIERLLALTRPAANSRPHPAPGPQLPPLGGHTAVARDDAFVFVYPSVLRGWRDAGAEFPSSRRLPTKRRTRRPTPSICRAAIPSCTPAGSPLPSGF